MTGVMPAGRAIYLEAVLGQFHEPAQGDRRTTAVLMVPPWGWDEIASYRARRAWAEALAEAGHPTLRIDIPGTGDSGGTPADRNLVEAWTGSIAAAAAWLAAVPGIGRVAAVGLGLGGLLTAAAITKGAPIDELVLWATPARGRAFLREQRAFAALQESRLGDDDDGALSGLPGGWLEVGGFVLSVETTAAIGALELASLPPGRVRRALLLERDGMGRDAELEVSLSAGGATVTTAPGPGWTEMVFHPERYRPPVEVIGRVTDWLALSPPETCDVNGIAPPASSDRFELTEDGIQIRESPLTIDRPFGRIFGILGEPVDAPATTLCAVFLNAGAVRRIGPNRLWVEVARRWNARGVATIRMDLEGLGEADGDPTRYLDVGNFYTDEFGAQVGAVLDELERRGFGPRFVLIGLCAGGYWAFHTAAADPRVEEAIIVNPRAMIWDDDLLERREAHKGGRLLEPALWRRIASGQVGAARMVAVSRAVVRTAASAVVAKAHDLRRPAGRDGSTDATRDRLDALRDRGTRVVLAFADDEPVYDELQADGILGSLDQWSNVDLRHLPGRDHTLRPIPAQRALHELLAGELDHLLMTGGA